VLVEFTSLERRDILRAAVRRWRTPFFEALAISDCAVLNSTTAASFDFSPAAEHTTLVRCFTRVLTDLFRMRRLRFCRARFSADSWFAKIYHSFVNYLKVNTD
jgi:plasmid stability protein